MHSLMSRKRHFRTNCHLGGPGRPSWAVSPPARALRPAPLRPAALQQSSTISRIATSTPFEEGSPPRDAVPDGRDQVRRECRHLFHTGRQCGHSSKVSVRGGWTHRQQAFHAQSLHGPQSQGVRARSLDRREEHAQYRKLRAAQERPEIGDRSPFVCPPRIQGHPKPEA